MVSHHQCTSAWMHQSGMCDVTLFGVRKIERFVSSMDVLNLRLSEDGIHELKEVGEPFHPYLMNF